MNQKGKNFESSTYTKKIKIDNSNEQKTLEEELVDDLFYYGDVNDYYILEVVINSDANKELKKLYEELEPEFRHKVGEEYCQKKRRKVPDDKNYELIREEVENEFDGAFSYVYIKKELNEKEKEERVRIKYREINH